MREVKYPLTEEAKSLARNLVEAWDSQKIDQLFLPVPHPQYVNYRQVTFLSTSGMEESFSKANYLELHLFGLIHFDKEILLLQELRNAVQNDFTVSDYFLTVNAVGTIIYGDATISAPFQSNATINSQVSQIQEITQSDITEKLLEGLGESFLKANQPIAEAIKSLKDEPEKSFKQKLGSVISELGNSMQHGANAYVVMQAIATIAPYIQNI